jgi:uncharacterized protein (DUF433 family)
MKCLIKWIFQTFEPFWVCAFFLWFFLKSANYLNPPAYFCKKNSMTNTLQAAGALLPKMSIADKTQLLQWVISDLTNVFPGIEKTPNVCGGDACVAKTRIPVWSLVNSRRLGMSDEDILRNFPTLIQVDLKNAWNYFRANQAEIEAEIHENEIA